MYCGIASRVQGTSKNQMLKIIEKIRRKGVKWFFWRLKNELRFPSKRITATIVDGLLSIRKKILGVHKINNKDELLYSIFDLKVAPITFNIIDFLIMSEYEANRSGKKGFVIVFVPEGSPLSYGWEDYDSVFDAEDKLWKFNNIVLPITLLSSKCKGVYVLPRRSDVFAFVEKKDVFPYLYDGVNLRCLGTKEQSVYRKVGRPHLVEGLRANRRGLNYIQEWQEGHGIQKPIVTITLRQSDFDPARNSNISEWSRFIKFLQGSDYCPVIIPETDKAFATEDLFPGVYIFRECAWNVGLRMALYESSYLNFFVSNGPSALCYWNNRCSYVAMNMLAEGSIVDTEKTYMREGIKVGDNFTFALPNQRLNWQPDTYENILMEFERFVEEFGDSSSVQGQ